jgi:glutathione S-transferase
MVTANTSPAVLITIPLSHYCEKARWALDRVALPYREEPHVPLLHRLATRRNGGTGVPLLVQGNRRWTDSTEILVHADAFRGGGVLYPQDAALRREVDSLEELFDSQLGPNARRWAYEYLLPDAKLLRSLWSREVPGIETLLLPLVTPIARRLIRSAYKVTPESAHRSLNKVRDVFREVDGHLSDGRRFLVGDCFTAADLTFATLAAPVLFPAECRAVLPSLDAVPLPMRDEVLGFRDTVAGQFALKMYTAERGRTTTMMDIELLSVL